MDKVFTVAEVVIPILVAILLGIYARRRAVISPEGNRGLQQFVMKFGLPCVLFTSCLTAELDAGALSSMAMVLPLMLCSALWAFRWGRKRYPYHNLPMLFAAQETGMLGIPLFIILFGAAAFTGVFMSLDGDQIISNWVMSMGIGKWGAFAIMMAIVFVLGMFIDWLGIVMIVFPIFLPIMDQFGFDRLWLVAVTATMLQTCFMTPPFGFALFYVKGILPDSVKIQEVYKGVIPFIAIIVVVTVLCAVFPPLVTWLPSKLAA